jgi:four helix bundle protein
MSLTSVVAEQGEWERACPDAITSDMIWKLDAYRASLFLADLARRDMKLAAQRALDLRLTGQLLHSAGSVSANLAEGYSRSTRADRLLFMSYALGSDRECVTWYRMAADILAPEVLSDRLILLARIRSLLLGLIRSTRKRTPSRRQFEG